MLIFNLNLWSHLCEDVADVSDWLLVPGPQRLVVVVQPHPHRGGLLPGQRGQQRRRLVGRGGGHQGG